MVSNNQNAEQKTPPKRKYEFKERSIALGGSILNIAEMTDTQIDDLIKSVPSVFDFVKIA